jgi:hypothetical protein
MLSKAACFGNSGKSRFLSGKKIIVVFAIFNFFLISSGELFQTGIIHSDNYILPPLVRLTNGTNDRNPNCDLTTNGGYGVNGNDWSFMVFERLAGGSSNIVVTKIGLYGAVDTGIYLTNNSYINKNPCVTDNCLTYSPYPTKAFVVWETNKNGYWDIYASRYNVNTGWSVPFPVDSSSINKTTARISYFDSTFIAIVYQKGNSIRFKRYNYVTNSFSPDTNLTFLDPQNCSNPNVISCNSYSFKNVFITYEKEISSNRKGVYYRIGNISGNVIAWSNTDTIAFTGSNRNSEFIFGFYDGVDCYFESNRTGDWNVYQIWLNYSTGSKTLYSVITNNDFDDYCYTGGNVPLGDLNEVHDFYGYLRKSAFNKKAVIRETKFSMNGDSLIFNLGTDTSFQSKIIKNSYLFSGCVRCWIIFNKDSLSAGIQSGIYGTHYTGCAMNIRNTGIIPEKFSLFQNYPNPFNPTTKIRFSIAPLMRGVGEARGVFTSLKVFDLLGKEIQTLVNEQLAPGTYEVTFDGSNYSSGIYFYKLQTEGFINTKRMILLK